MKKNFSIPRFGFTLLETVIAIGVLAVLLTGFMIVFAPAAAGIRKSINIQEADRLTTTLEQEMVTLRPNLNSDNFRTGFDKAYKWIEDSMKKTSPEVIFVYQYRGDISKTRDDGTPEPFYATSGIPGMDFKVVSMARTRNQLTGGPDPYFEADLKASEGRVFAVKAIQLVFSADGLTLSNEELIKDPSPGEPITGTTPPISGAYPEAVISFAADFYDLPSKSPDYLKAGGKFDSNKLKKPVFSRNLAVRR